LGRGTREEIKNQATFEQTNVFGVTSLAIRKGGGLSQVYTDVVRSRVMYQAAALVDLSRLVLQCLVVGNLDKTIGQ
jgi:hypothetical protein